MQALRLRARLDPQLLGKSSPELSVLSQGLSLPSAPVQGKYQLPAQPFSQRAGPHPAAQLADDVGVPAKQQPRLHPIFERVKPGIAETTGDCPQRARQWHARERLAPPQVK
jgi:hypothetical protein